MSQIVLPFETPEAAPTAFDAAGFEIGWDFAHHRLVPPPDHLHGAHPVRQGWDAGRAAFGLRTLKPTRHVRQWLALRLTAWARGEAFEPVRVTPRFLGQIDAERCPVTRECLTHGDDGPAEATIVRVYEGAGHAAGNLAVISRRAAQARGGRSAREALDLAQRLERGEAADGHGLDARAWHRLAALLRLAEPAAHERIACLPLLVLPPNRLHVLNPVHALQATLTLLMTGATYARRMTGIAALVPSPEARRAYYVFMNTLLARRLAAGWAADRVTVRQALEDAWTHPMVQRRWEDLVLRLGAADIERIVRLAAQRGLMATGCQWMDEERAIDGWSIETQGRSVTPAAPLTMPRASRSRPAPDARTTARRAAEAGSPA